MVNRPRHGSHRSNSPSDDDGHSSSMDHDSSSRDSGLSVHSYHRQPSFNEMELNWGHVNAATAALTSWPSTKHWFLRQLELQVDMETLLRPHLHHLCESTANLARMMSIFYAKYDFTEEQGMDLVRHYASYDLCYSLYSIAIVNDAGDRLLEAWEQSDNHRIVQYLRTNSKLPVDGLFRPFSTPLKPPTLQLPRNNNVTAAKSRKDSGVFVDIEQIEPMLPTTKGSAGCPKQEGKPSVMCCSPMVKFVVCTLVLMCGLMGLSFHMYFAHPAPIPETSASSFTTTTPPPEYERKCKWLSEAAEIIGQTSSEEDDYEEDEEEENDDEEMADQNLHISIDSVVSKLPTALPPPTKVHLTIVNTKTKEGTDWWLSLSPSPGAADRVAKLILMGQFSNLELIHFCNLFPNVKMAYSLPSPYSSDFSAD